MKIEDFYKKTTLQVNREKNKKRIEFTIEGDTIHNRPAVLYVTFAKSKKIKDAMVDQIKKMNGEDIEVCNEWWLVPQQYGEIFMDLHEEKKLIRFEIENGSDNYGYGVIYITKGDAEKIVEEIASIIA